MSSFILALQFLTRIPIASSTEWHGPVIGRSVMYFPLIGLLIGVFLALLARLLAAYPELMGGALILLIWVMITGGLHLDGLADSADAWAGGLGDQQRSLEIMKDPRSGALAIVVLVLVLLLKFTAIVAVLDSNQWPGLLLAPLLGRSAVVLLFLTTPYVRLQGLGSDMAKYLPERPAVVVLLIIVLGIAFALDIKFFLILIIFTTFLFWIIRKLMIQRVGGMTGDTAGAMIELIETAVLVLSVLIQQ